MVTKGFVHGGKLVTQQPGSVEPQTLGDRLRGLRSNVWGRATTQKQVAEALRISVPLVSSWEQNKAVPSEEKLRSLALFFCLGEDREQPLPDLSELSAAEDRRRRELIDELIKLRDAARSGTPRSTLASGRFWNYPDGAKIRILTTPMWQDVVGKAPLADILAELDISLDDAVSGVSVRDILKSTGRVDPDGSVDRIPYANPRHPNYMESLHDGDRDATVELIGHLRAENPTADIRFLTSDRASRDDLTGHVVILGQADQLGRTTPEGPSPLEWLFRRQELPLTTLLKGENSEFDSVFVVTEDTDGRPAYYPSGVDAPRGRSYGPIFLRDETDASRPRLYADGYPQLEYDIALLARQPNELNADTSVTICAGIFSRGTYGAVRAFTDTALRAANERYLTENFDLNNFWMLFYVPVFAGETVTPDLNRPLHRVRSSSSDQ
jgi:transcriptional regulator with XRE-family HTH domain